jgi:hypothetical protein
LLKAWSEIHMMVKWWQPHLLLLYGLVAFWLKPLNCFLYWCILFIFFLLYTYYRRIKSPSLSWSVAYLLFSLIALF